MQRHNTRTPTSSVPHGLPSFVAGFGWATASAGAAALAGSLPASWYIGLGVLIFAGGMLAANKWGR